jgi:16S rRNA (cytosine967-C5)-methyltransferase
LCKSKGETSFVNAILRNYQRNGDKIVKYPSEKEHPARFLSICYSFPEWITESFISDYGYENAKGICSAMSDRPPCVTLRTNTLKTNPATFKEKLTELGFSYTDGIYTDSAIKLAEGSKISDIFGYEEGLFFVQDEASQISSRVLAPAPDSIVIDVCACPGSKSFGASIEMKGKGKVYSFDLHENKLSLVTSSAQRLGIENIEVAKRDARDPVPELIGSADAVICDVPCSGLGVIAKKPDIRYKTYQEIEKLPEVQYAILEASKNYLRDDGFIIYSTCTLRKDENENVIRRFLENNKDFELCPTGIFGDDVGTVTFLPHKTGTDGFFAAKLRKKK